MRGYSLLSLVVRKIQQGKQVMDKMCYTCRYWTQMPDMQFGMEKEIRSTGESLCSLSRNMSFGAYGQDGKAIITGPSFGCNQWKIKENEVLTNHEK